MAISPYADATDVVSRGRRNSRVATSLGNALEWFDIPVRGRG